MAISATTLYQFLQRSIIFVFPSKAGICAKTGKKERKAGYEIKLGILTQSMLIFFQYPLA